MSFCPDCGNRLDGSSFCPHCGSRAGTPTATATATADAGSVPTRTAIPTPASAMTARVGTWQESLPEPWRSLPVELLAVCGLMAAAGLLTLWPVVRALPDTFNLLGDGAIARDFGLFTLSVLLVLGFFGVSCLLLAWRLAHADRVARGLAYVLLGGLAAAILIGDNHPTSLVLVLLACVGSLVVLALAPRVQEFFRAAEHLGDEPSSVVIARTLVAVWCWCAVVVGVLFVPLSALGAKYVVVGVFLLALAGGGFVQNRRLSQANRTARVIVTAGAAAYLVLLLIVGQRAPGMLLPLALGVGIIVFLWVPAEAKVYFGDVAPASAVPPQQMAG